MPFYKSRIPLSVVSLAGALLLASGVSVAQERRALGELDESVKELAAQVNELSAQSSTNAEAVQDLSNRVGVLTQELEALRRQQKAVPEAVRVIDDLTLRLRAAERELDHLRTRIAAIEAPETVPPATGGGVAYDEGFLWTSGTSSLKFNAYLQPRLQVVFDDDLDSVDEATFLLRRARLGLSGQLLSPRLRYKFLLEVARDNSPTRDGEPLRDGWLEYAVLPELAIRAGQQKTQFLRTFIASSWALSFPERAGPLEALRYDRDIGVWAHGELFDRLQYDAGFTNGGGPNQLNDNIDFLASLRLQGRAFGEELRLPFGDFAGVEVPSLSVGAGILHDLVQVPQNIAGVEVGNVDVDNDSVIDNIRVVSTSADALFRYRGLELFFEGLWRHERWGTILEHSANESLAAAIDPLSDGNANYLAFATHATYFVLPRILVGGRVSYGETALLPVTGREVFSQVPPGDNLLNLDFLAELYDDRGIRQLGLMYRFENFDDGTTGDIEHILLLEAQLRI